MPGPVLGGATLLMFGTVAAAGIKIIASQEINRKATLVIALSFSLGIERGIGTRNLEPIANDVENPLLIRHHHRGGLTAILCNLVIRIKE